MSKPPRIAGRDLRKVLEHKGFVFVRQKGSHMMLRRATAPVITVSIPDHKEIAPGTLRGILRDVGMSVGELNELL
ncbi:MAG: type II toxin-antitoxin system HicA family toxin [Chloroflexi bacterium]|nr:type II toxin-antitoxin system HicA family toxin [Chloroflexota bacterium]